MAQRISPRLAGLVLFGIALALRLLFWQATPDSEWAYSCWYKGDAPLWMEYARALVSGGEYELGLPLRPPAMVWWMALFAGRETAVAIAVAKAASCLIGAFTVLVIHDAVRRIHGDRIARISGLACAFSSGLLVLSTTLNNEAPYLLLVAISIWLFERLRTAPRVRPLIAMAVLAALGCLLRVEHVLFAAISLALLAWGWTARIGMRPALSWLGGALLLFLAVLAPWHVAAWGAIARYNQVPLPQSHLLPPPLKWTPQTLRELRSLPAFFQPIARDFVMAMARSKNRNEIAHEDFEDIARAFGTMPQALAAHPFVTLYGPLNFYLANNPQAGGGFSRAGLQRPLPPGDLLLRFPQAQRLLPRPGKFEFIYPPHLQLFNEGYSLGLQWIRSDPGAFMALVARKLARFWAGAAQGYGGYALPLGLGGTRHRVDLVIAPRSPLVNLWRWGLLGLTALGFILCRRRRSLAPWMLFLGCQVLVNAAFFGYARAGACTIPVVVLLAVLSLDRLLITPLAPFLAARPRWIGRGAVLALPALLIVLEVWRYSIPPRVFLDDVEVVEKDPWPIGAYRDVEVRLR